MRGPAGAADKHNYAMEGRLVRRETAAARRVLAVLLRAGHARRQANARIHAAALFTQRASRRAETRCGSRLARLLLGRPGPRRHAHPGRGTEHLHRTPLPGSPGTCQCSRRCSPGSGTRPRSRTRRVSSPSTSQGADGPTRCCCRHSHTTASSWTGGVRAMIRIPIFLWTSAGALPRAVLHRTPALDVAVPPQSSGRPSHRSSKRPLAYRRMDGTGEFSKQSRMIYMKKLRPGCTSCLSLTEVVLIC